MYSFIIIIVYSVCSTDDSSSLMLDCIHAGAADFILKPFRLDVIKTLFLVDI
jgi:DNA-binding NarL/FixJ family response regulator